jgi:hypothetical protein
MQALLAGDYDWTSLVNHKTGLRVRHLRLTVVVKRSEIAVGQPHGTGR